MKKVLIASSIFLVSCNQNTLEKTDKKEVFENNTKINNEINQEISGETKVPKFILHKADSRGHALHDWLESFHTFSFADYFDPNRIEFGALRVINEDKVAGGQGFHTHPHNNMEIITLPISGGVKHGDNMGNGDIVNAGEVQVMSAGKGLEHSEMNASETETVHFLQIWVQPKKVDVEPRYDKVSIKEGFKKNEFQTILTPEEHKEKNAAWIYQDAWFSLANFDEKIKKNYKIHKDGNGVYLFIIKGKVKVGNQILEEKDGLGVYNIDNFDIEALENAEILLMEVPMK